MTHSQSADALVSVRWVVADHYQGEPVPGLDPLVSDFTGFNIKRVPVIRVFGSTCAGQRACLHIHGVFPYLFVPLPSGEKDGFEYRLSASLDKAINISLGQSSASTQHVYKAVKVSGIPMYGYHPRQHNFVKIYFYNPHMVKRAAEMLQGGAILNKILQPHESHTNMVLQFMMDYNLQGMNMVHLRHAMFRQGKLEDEYDEMESIIEAPWMKNRRKRHASMDSSTTSPDSDPASVLSQYLKIHPDQRYFYQDEMDDCLKLPRDVVRQSSSELELDAVAADIINHLDVAGVSMNPGLVSLWEDERERRRQCGITAPLTPPSSPPRDARSEEKSDSEKFWFERLCRALEDKKLNTSDNQASDNNSVDPDATVNIDKRLRPQVYAVESSDHDVTVLPAATQLDPHIQSLSESILNGTSLASTNQTDVSHFDRSSYGDETIVDEDLILSQMKGDAGDSDEEVDEELVDLLADLVTNDNDDKRESIVKTPDKASNSKEDLFKTPSAPRSQGRSQGSAKKSRAEILIEEEEEESLEMSQVVWETHEDWDDLDKTLMEDFAKNLDDSEPNCDDHDIEDMFRNK